MTEKKRSGPKSLFTDKVLARRSACLTRLGNMELDALRTRLAADLGRKSISLGDLFEVLVHHAGKTLDAATVQRIADRINAQTDRQNGTT